MAAVRNLVSLGRAARNKVKIRTRQPLPAVLLVTALPDLRHQPELLEHLADELNVKEIRFVEDATPYVRYEVKPRFDLLGPRLGRRVQDLARRLAALEPLAVFRALEGQGRLTVTLDGEEVALVPAEVDVRMHTAEGYAAEGLGGEFAILDVRLTPDLVAEGRARELVHQVQQMRKDAGLDLADRIVLYIEGDAALDDLLGQHRDYVLRETLGLGLERRPPTAVTTREVRLDGLVARVGIEKAQ